MSDVLTLVGTTVLIFIIQQACLWAWNKIKARHKNKKQRRKNR